MSIRVNSINAMTDSGLFLAVDEDGTAYLINVSADPLGAVRLQVELDFYDMFSEGELVVWSRCLDTSTDHLDEIRKGHILMYRSADGVVNASAPIWKLFRIDRERERLIDEYVRLCRNRIASNRRMAHGMEGAA